MSIDLPDTPGRASAQQRSDLAHGPHGIAGCLPADRAGPDQGDDAQCPAVLLPKLLEPVPPLEAVQWSLTARPRTNCPGATSGDE